MNGLIRCDNGHYYDSQLEKCPHCKEDSQDFSKTFIKSHSTPHSSFSRKLVGWLVSFSLDPNGKDFRIFEGKNTIGSLPENDIVIPDPTVSKKHFTILYRHGKFLFKDEFSTNGTLINGEILSEGELKHGDKITIGNTCLILITICNL